MLVRRISIYETYMAPFVTSVEVINSASSAATTVWQGTDTTSCGSFLDILIADGVIADTIKVNTLVFGYEQIDAVQVCGEIVKSPPSMPPLPPSPPAVPPPCSGQVDLVLVLDNSGSVGAQRSEVLRFARQVVSEFTMGATAAQIGYVEFETTVVTHTGLTSSLPTIIDKIDNAPATGQSTFLSGGIERGHQVVTGTGARAGVPKVMVLLGDGVQTIGGDDNTAIGKATTAKAAGIRIIAVGFGSVSVTTLNAIASSPSSVNAVYKSTARDVVDLMTDGKLGICVTATDVPHGPPPSPPAPPSPPKPPQIPPPPPPPPPPLPPPSTPPVDCNYCSDIYANFAAKETQYKNAGACPGGTTEGTDGAGKRLCKVWVDGRMWFVPRE
jgi:hypothetical protein